MTPRSTPRTGGARHLVVTCEHASCAVPRDLRGLGLPAAVLRSHRGWDPGALPIARAVAAAFGAPLHAGRWSRLVADLNRSDDHPRVVVRRMDGRAVPGNRLTPAEREQRLADHWRPWRAAVERELVDAAARGGVVHLSVHSFTEMLGGVERRNDIGLLCDPSRAREVAFCVVLAAELRARGLGVRRNFPYFGDTDGFTTRMRGCTRPARYLGIEIECNQRLSRTVSGQRRLAGALVAALRATLPAP